MKIHIRKGQIKVGHHNVLLKTSNWRIIQFEMTTKRFDILCDGQDINDNPQLFLIPNEDTELNKETYNSSTRITFKGMSGWKFWIYESGRYHLRVVLKRSVE